MIIGSTDPEENRIRFRASDQLFRNANCVFVEYLDAIQLPWFTFLSFFRENRKVEDTFNVEEIRYLSPNALILHYLNRMYRNPLADLLKDKTNIPFEKLDALLADQINSSEIFFQPNLDTNLRTILNNLLANQLIKKLMIYYPEENEFVKKDITEKFGTEKVEVVFGSMKDALEKTPIDTTYFFSDVMNVLLLEETKKIQLSAIMLPVDYRYNYVDDEKKDFLVNMNYLSEKYVFKWGTYRVS